MREEVPELQIRSARIDDIPAIHSIQEHYVNKTILNFSYEPASVEEMKDDYNNVIRDGFPYYVATSSSYLTSTTSIATGSSRKEVVGYAYVHSFRTRDAYQYTGELSIFCKPGCTGRGIGKKLLDKVIHSLRESSAKARGLRGRLVDTMKDHNESSKDIDERRIGRPKDVHQLMACMTVDPDRNSDEKLVRFYAREGFVETALLKHVGWKFGQWLDTRYMQLAL